MTFLSYLASYGLMLRRNKDKRKPYDEHVEAPIRGQGYRSKKAGRTHPVMDISWPLHFHGPRYPDEQADLQAHTDPKDKSWRLQSTSLSTRSTSASPEVRRRRRSSLPANPTDIIPQSSLRSASSSVQLRSQRPSRPTSPEDNPQQSLRSISSSLRLRDQQPSRAASPVNTCQSPLRAASSSIHLRGKKRLPHPQTSEHGIDLPIRSSLQSTQSSIQLHSRTSSRTASPEVTIRPSLRSTSASLQSRRQKPSRTPSPETTSKTSSHSVSSSLQLRRQQSTRLKDASRPQFLTLSQLPSRPRSMISLRDSMFHPDAQKTSKREAEARQPTTMDDTLVDGHDYSWREKKLAKQRKRVTFEARKDLRVVVR